MLYELSLEEQRSAAKKKTLLSLSKLAAYAASNPPDSVHGNLDGTCYNDLWPKARNRPVLESMSKSN